MLSPAVLLMLSWMLLLLGITSALPVEPRAKTYSGDGWFRLACRRIQSANYMSTGTFYEPALGACGKTNNKHDLIVAVGHKIFDSYP
ncbi:hypothetical protein C8R43DRAFT_679095 [Mycena crocata]|nr:hypothetical protein C8R43DRAFT_679095 [Mycena crocata]